MIIALQTLIFFRESIITVLERLIVPYYKRFSFAFKNNHGNLDEDESEEQVFAEFDDDKGVVFFPPMYVQRYAAVNDCLLDERWRGKLEKIVDLGYHDMSFIKYLKEVPGIKHILGVDMEMMPLHCSSDLVVHGEYTPKHETPLQIILFQGNAADPDYRLIGCDAVVAIEMIEHMLPHDLERLVHNIFGFIQPQIAVITTPNADFNVLFKAMEKNGLRRWDHLFEWTREQFHDWCSNIVLRYPNYTVTCKGIGPGPPGTLHYGCCSQLALFVSKSYHKQQDLTIDSLALVKNLSKDNNLSDMEDSWECTDAASESNIICGPANEDLFLESYSEKNSIMTIVVTTMPPPKILEYKDNTVQCSIDKDAGRSYLMFDEHVPAKVLVPRRKISNTVYDMEDVNNRLNCSTLQVKKFSKATQNLMAKNKTDIIVHTKDIVDHIQQLTKMLNLDKSKGDEKHDSFIWKNINWGENAPYWNKYYKIVREYNYPFEIKSDECRIVELLSDEINRLIDMQCTDEDVITMENLEIPLDYLMRMVEHITDDKNKVIDLLEWNGYDVVDNFVIHSRPNVENLSMATPEIEWQDNVTVTDWDVKEIHSTSHSNGSPVSSERYGKGLQHIFEYKVGKLRALLTADEDITAELNQVVYRLMKLALKASRDRDTPPTATWLQCKLLDLLTLTERAIERRKRHYFDKNQLTIQSTDFQENQKVEQLELSNAEDNTVKEIVDKYCHFIEPSENTDDFNGVVESYVHTEVEDNVSVTSMVKIFDNNDDTSSSPTRIDRTKHFKGRTRERKSPTSGQWKYDNYSAVSSSGDTDHSFKSDLRSSSRRADKRCKREIDNVYPCVNVRAKRRRLSFRDYKINENCGVRNDRKRLLKRFIVKKNLRWYLLKHTVKYEHYKIGIKKIVRQHRPLKTFIKPVSIINLRQRGANKDLLYTLKHDLIKSNNEMSLHKQESIAVTEESCILEIITDGMNETIAFRRTIATDAYDNSVEIGEQLTPSSNKMVAEEKTLMPEDVESNRIFLYDINEPSTSKGIRHVNMDVQCGSDDVLSPFLSPVTSLHRIPGIITNNANDVYSENVEPHEECLECNVLKNNENLVDDSILNFKTKSNGIQIKDSAVALHKSENISDESNFKQDFREMFGSKLKNIDVLERVKVSNVMESKKFYSDIRSSAWDAENERETFPKSIYEKNYVVADLKSDVNKENNLKNDVAFPKADIKRTLICGGIIVHSYKDRSACEDILYQGKWQRSALRLIKTNPRNVVTVRNYSDLPTTNVKNYNKEVFEQKILEKTSYKNQKCINNREKLQIEKSKDQKVISSKKSPVVSSTPVKCSDKKIKMASTKIPLSLVVCKNTKNKNNTSKEVNKSMVNAIKENKTTANLRKKNISKYLQSRKCMYIPKSLEKIQDPISDAQKIGIINDDLVTSSRTKIKKELLKYICDPSHDITYSVFRNQIENKKGSDIGGLVVNEINNNKEDKTTSNFQSANSSCSSDNSVATIKQLSPHNKDIQANGKFISTKSFLRLKIAKKSSPIRNDNGNCKRSTFMFENKENYPESSISNIKNAKEKTQDPIKSILTAQNTVSNPKNNLSNVKNKKNSKDISTNSCLSRISLCKKVLLPNAMENAENYKQICNKHDRQKQVHILEFSKKELLIENLSIPQSTQIKSQEIGSRNNKSSVENTDVKKIGKHCVALYDEVRTMLEERLNFIENLSVFKRPAADNRKITSVDCNEICDNSSLDKSVAEDSATSSWRSGPEPVHVDLISFKSFASISGFSEYYNADNKRNSTLDSLQIFTPPVRSVNDIFERNDQLRVANSVGLMGTQGFSRFSINERIMGDQPDYVNLIDSETGSLAHCVEVRRATSEEVFTSGRSSDTYVSCQVDDENVVPHWLFRMNNRQDSDEEQSTPTLSPVPLPAVAPQLDVNGNALDQGVGVGAGAGDGRGIHSDQDSSGRDTSLSSTDTSSGQQSEALLVEPSGFASNMEFLREPSSRPFLQIPSTGVPNASFRTAEGSENDNVYNVSEGSNQNALNHETITSDRDADVSSLDTDIADFSDN